MNYEWLLERARAAELRAYTQYCFVWRRGGPDSSPFQIAWMRAVYRVCRLETRMAREVRQ